MQNKKKINILIIFIISIFISLYVFAGQVQKVKILLGDTDKNNVVNKRDAELILEKVSKEKNGEDSKLEIPITADTNSDNKIDIADVVNIMRYTKSSKGEVNNSEWISELEPEIEFGIVEDEIKIDVSEQVKRKATIQGKNYGNITYKMENEEISKVDANGRIEGIKNGETKLILTESKGKLSVDCKVIVQTSPTGIALNKTSATLDLSGTKTLTLTSTITPSTANINTGITWTSSNTNIATVDSYGKVTGKANGSCTITAKTANGKTATCSITVKTTTTSIKLSSTNIYLDLTHTSKKITATQSPSTISSKGITWASSNTKVATVDSTGKINRVGTGTATITATAKDGSGKKATCKVTVKKEKLIICGPSTVRGLSGLSTVSGIYGENWGIDYYKAFGYTVKATSAQIQEGGAYEKITNSTSNSSADLFFVCKGGVGLRYFAGESFNGISVTQKNTSNSECFKTIDTGVGGKNLENLLKEGNTNNWHFTVAFVCSGNDLTIGNMSEKIVDNIAKINADYVAYLANKYPKHNFHVFPITPIDESSVKKGSNLLINKYTVTNSNNKKRYRFACTLNNEVNAKTESNLKYANGFFLDLMENSRYVGTFGGRTCTGNKKYIKLNGKESTTAAYRTYDGVHYEKWGCRIVMEQILVRCGVVDSKGMKLK